MIKQTVLLFFKTLTKTCLQIEKSFFKPIKVVVPISSIAAEIFLQHYGNLIAKFMIQTGYVMLYPDILI
jgi:hypothetical protein